MNICINFFNLYIIVSIIILILDIILCKVVVSKLLSCFETDNVCGNSFL